MTPALEALLAAFKVPYAERAEQTLQAASASLAQLESGTAVPITVGSPQYTAWRCEQLLECHRVIPDEQRAEAERLLDLAGFLGVCKLEGRSGVEKHGTNLIVT